jgi:hypothetical protein
MAFSVGQTEVALLISPAEMARLEPSQPQHASEKDFMYW